MKKPVSKFEILEIVATTLKDEYTFASDKFLDEKKVTRLIAFRRSDFSKSPRSKNNTVTDNAFAASFLNISYNGRQHINLLPLTELNRGMNDGQPVDFDFSDV